MQTTCKTIYLGVREILPEVKVIQRRTAGRQEGHHRTVIVDVKNSTELQEVEGMSLLMLCPNRFRDITVQMYQTPNVISCLNRSCTYKMQIYYKVSTA
jgi:hypothetical protein